MNENILQIRKQLKNCEIKKSHLAFQNYNLTFGIFSRHVLQAARADLAYSIEKSEFTLPPPFDPVGPLAEKQITIVNKIVFQKSSDQCGFH